MTEFTTEFLNVQELAELLKCSKATIYRLTDRRDIPFHRLPRGLRFAMADVRDYLTGCRVESVSTNYASSKIQE